MPDIETLNHTKWDCKYHVVFIPKYRRKALSHEFGGISGRSSGRWQRRRNVGLKKGT
jgi:putative transposase